MNIRKYITAKKRRKALETHLGITLSNIGVYSFDENQASTKNCENFLGAVQVPLGIAGPLFFRETKKEIYVPLATTEGALIASVQRGCKAIQEAGGVRVQTEYVGITRAPAFAVEGIAMGFDLQTWVRGHLQELHAVVQKTSSHLRLLGAESFPLGKTVFVRFAFDSKDAMGMNMATIATDAMVLFIEQQTGARCITISSNMCVDKKPNFLNFISGRGHKVWAEITIPKMAVKKVLKTSVDEFVYASEKKLYQGSLLAGTIGANAQMANTLAAVFLATGQDMGHVGECSMGITTVEKQGKDLYVSIYLPDLIIGTVGGGTMLATQKEALRILGIEGGDAGENAKNLARSIAGIVLAGEISLLASLAEGSLARAHRTLGRGEKV